MNLLHAHIRNQMPSAFVFTHHSWNLEPAESAVVVTQRLQKIDPAFPRQSITFLLFDEGQDSYGDPLFWNAFTKEAGDEIYPYYRVILFCTYGSPSSHPVDYEIGSPPGLRPAARISLWPVSRGILLQWSEFLEVVSHFERPLNVHPDLLSLIFIWTVGHVGAVVELLRLILSCHVSSNCSSLLFLLPRRYQRRGMGNSLRYKTFMMKIPFISLYDALTREPLNVAFLGYFYQTSWHCLEDYSKTEKLK
jgi:hypothetical protein